MFRIRGRGRQELQIQHFHKADPAYGSGVAKGLGLNIETIIARSRPARRIKTNCKLSGVVFRQSDTATEKKSATGRANWVRPVALQNSCARASFVLMRGLR